MVKKRLGIVDQDDRDNMMSEEHALRTAAVFLQDRVKNRRCDSDGVATCERCSTSFLADRVLYALQQDLDAEGSDERAD